MQETCTSFWYKFLEHLSPPLQWLESTKLYDNLVSPKKNCDGFTLIVKQTVSQHCPMHEKQIHTRRPNVASNNKWTMYNIGRWAKNKHHTHNRT